MENKKIADILKTGEIYNIEFKECKREINKNVYETVCAFLNRAGGELLLGVDDSGKIYDRKEDGDLNITDNTNLVSILYIRKQTKIFREYSISIYYYDRIEERFNATLP